MGNCYVSWVVLAVPCQSYRSTQRIQKKHQWGSACWLFMLHKTVLCWTGTEKLTWGSVFRWKSFDSVNPSVPLSVLAFSPVCTWRLYPSTSTVWDVVWQRYSLTKESILSGCLSIYLSCLSIHLFFMPFAPNQMCWNQSVTGAKRGPRPAKA